MSMRTFQALLLVAVAAGLTAACSSEYASPSATPSHQVVNSGTLTGHLLRVGGPSPGKPIALSGTVTVQGPSGSQDVIVDSSGRYTVSVSPGTYSVVGHSPQVSLACPGEGKVHVRAGATAKLDAICSIR